MSKSLSFPLALAALLAFGGSAAAQAQSAAPQPTLDVQAYVLPPDLPLSEAEARRVLAPYTGPKRTLHDLEAAAQALEQRLRAGGNSFMRVYVPAQRPSEGRVRLDVVQFKLGEVEVSGNRYFSERNIRASLPTLREGEPPELTRLSEDVAASNTNPAKQTSVTFRESQQPGAVDAVVRVKDAPPSSFIVSSTANYAVSSQGPHADVLRLSGAWQHANLFGRDHVATLSYTTDPRDVGSVSLFGAYYQLPFYGTGITGSAFYTYSNVNSGRVPQGLNYFDVSGSGRFYGLRLAKSLPRLTPTLQPTLGLSLEDRLFRNSTSFNGVQLQPDVSSRVLAASYALRGEPDWGLWNASLEWAGNVGGGEGNTRERHAANGGERGWHAWRYAADALLPAGRWQLAGRLRGQYMNSRLIAGEQFGLGGAGSVRGFTDRVVAGERGWQWTLEATGPGMAGQELRPVVFVDGGHVQALSSGQRETLAAGGAGLRWARPGWQLALDLARVLNDATLAGDPKAVRLHLGFLARF